MAEGRRGSFSALVPQLYSFLLLEAASWMLFDTDDLTRSLPALTGCESVIPASGFFVLPSRKSTDLSVTQGACIQTFAKKNFFRPFESV